ncbi:MAG: DUF4290 domain-containing protein [Bacteroidales bacterium]|nr:DUF4290 domain-containing protein [Bacteroidales bacterium]MBD5206555.1 DUF4290 domain-containing protein [Bacteroidales bacterium]MBD5224113.1 DUF4290 domain-containing protein [Bacteroidales bacterium]MBD5301855.1 DUF4290 domain-containing protein [Bacteroides sp.]MBD5348477.1 DUF4290 domain-containing protein [Bacteroides sp.]
MLPYNTDMEPVLLPEYGRNLQGLVDYCVNIPDREERTACAYAVADTMAALYPSLVGDNQDYSQIWNHINIMSRFELDIDWPCEVMTAEKLHPVPERLPYTTSEIRFRHYGKNIEKMIEVVSDLEEGEEKQTLISMIANQMKKLMLQHNPEGVDDAKILKDLKKYSNGKIDLDPETNILHEFKEIPQSQYPSRRKKRK